jgi:hypothetical protein
MSDRPTPETEAATLNKWQDSCPLQVVPKSLALRLERQRDELLEIANRAVSALDGNLRCEETCKCSGRHQISELQAAIAAVKGGEG